MTTNVASLQRMPDLATLIALDRTARNATLWGNNSIVQVACLACRVPLWCVFSFALGTCHLARILSGFVNNIGSRSSIQHNFTFKIWKSNAQRICSLTICRQPFCLSDHLTLKGYLSGCRVPKRNQKDCALSFRVRPEEVDDIVVVKRKSAGAESLSIRREI
jgi:hypothetical protein